MGFIKEPKGVDFIIQSKPLTDKDRQEISKHIADYKSKHGKKQAVKTKSKQPA
ncbi:MAG: hypothetical protein ACRDE2_04830 [Chitinophagaceae bacterium]